MQLPEDENKKAASKLAAKVLALYKRFYVYC
jgi:hypothetical protein